MPNGTLDGLNRILDFDESLTHVFRVTAIVFLRQPRCRGGAQPLYLVLRSAFERTRYPAP